MNNATATGGVGGGQRPKASTPKTSPGDPLLGQNTTLPSPRPVIPETESWRRGLCGGVPMKEGECLGQDMEPLTHLVACRRGALERKTLLRMDERIPKGLCREISAACVRRGVTNWSSAWGFGFCDGSRSHQQGSRNRLNSMGITMVGGLEGGWERWVLTRALGHR